LFAELESAYQRQAPIMLWVYAPHWAPAKFKGAWVEFPEYTSECYSDPAWGINPSAAYDCGKPFGEIWKVGWAGLKDKWPGAHAAVTAFTIDNDEMGAMITKVDLDGMSVEDVVSEWMTSNEAVGPDGSRSEAQAGRRRVSGLPGKAGGGAPCPVFLPVTSQTPWQDSLF
jgi:glycine betaine/proline transport system substrate-binding protein